MVCELIMFQKIKIIPIVAKKTITVKGNNISLVTQNEDDYISLTDIAKGFVSSEEDDRNSDYFILNWLRLGSTVEFLGAWEQIHNLDFNSVGYDRIKTSLTSNTFRLSVKKWLEETSAVGITAKSGRYGGTYAHRDIAIQFCYWLSPTFQIYLIKEFQRLKDDESDRLKLDWNLKRTLAKVNYRIHTDAVKTYLIPPKFSETKVEGLYYASEADILNLALFGVTAKQWREDNAELKGNIRDHATTEQLLVLSNLENLNAEFIKLGMDKETRLSRLNETAIHQIGLFVGIDISKQLKGEDINK